MSLYTLSQLSGQSPALPVEFIWSRKTTNGWEIVARENFLYDDKGRITKASGSNTENEASHTKLYIYLSDTSHKEIHTEIVNGKTETYYDSIVMNSNGVEISYGLEDTGQPKPNWIPSLKRTIVKDTEDHIVKETYERYREGKWHPEDRMLYFFDGNKCKEEYFQMREEEDWVTHQKSVHHYDKIGNLALTKIFSQNKTVMIPDVIMQEPDMQIVYSYDKDGNLLERVSQTFKDRAWVDEFKRTCIY